MAGSGEYGAGKQPLVGMALVLVGVAALWACGLLYTPRVRYCYISTLFVARKMLYPHMQTIISLLRHVAPEPHISALSHSKVQQVANICCRSNFIFL